MRILSGIQPSGSLHLGNFFGMMQRMIKYQKEHELFCFIVNYHALTTVFDAPLLRENTFQAACDFLSLGIDPKASIFWIRSTAKIGNPKIILYRACHPAIRAVMVEG